MPSAPSTAVPSAAAAPTMDLATWMRDLDVLHHPFYRLRVPGTHNSATSVVHGFDPLASPLRPYVALLYAFPFVPVIISLWTRCQALGVRQQLEAGVRFLDLRVAVKDGEAYVAHTMRGPPLAGVLDEIADFYEAHGTTEVCVVSVKRDSENEAAFQDPEIRRVVRRTISDHRVARFLSTVPNPLRAPLRDHHDRPLVLLLERVLWEPDGPGYEAPYFFNEWFDVSDPAELRERVAAALPAVGESRQTMAVLQNILTPGQDEVVSAVLLYVALVLSALAIVGACIAGAVVGPRAAAAHPATWICVAIPLVALAAVWLGLRPAPSLLAASHPANADFTRDVVDAKKSFNVVTVDGITPAFARGVVNLNEALNNHAPPSDASSSSIDGLDDVPI